MTANGWLQIALLLSRRAARHQAAGPVHGHGLRRLGPLARAGWSGRSTGWPASIRRRTSTGPGTPGAMLLFSVARMLLTYLVLRLQHVLPLEPAGLPAVPDRQAFETAASFTTNTNWQSYAGETTMSYFSQMTPAHLPQLRLGRDRAWRSPWR